jgi:hypothetical protein
MGEAQHGAGLGDGERPGVIGQADAIAADGGGDGEGSGGRARPGLVQIPADRREKIGLRADRQAHRALGLAAGPLQRESDVAGAEIDQEALRARGFLLCHDGSAL